MAASDRPALRLVQQPAQQALASAWFCGHCAAPPTKLAVPAPASRVCADCGLGLLLEARTDAIPRLNEAFLVVDHSLTVAGLSREAETLLGVAETDAVHRPLTELLVPADAEALGPENLAVAVTWAARGEDEETRTVHVRPTNVFGVRFTARIAPCGPPRAALVVLAD